MQPSNSLKRREFLQASAAAGLACTAATGLAGHHANPQAI